MHGTETNVPQNCWEFMECPPKIKEKCPAYQNNTGKDCWFFWNAKGGCPVLMIGKGCIDCNWFKLLNTDKIEETI
jgi:hypothetical protein